MSVECIGLAGRIKWEIAYNDMILAGLCEDTRNVYRWRFGLHDPQQADVNLVSRLFWLTVIQRILYLRTRNSLQLFRLKMLWIRYNRM